MRSNFFSSSSILKKFLIFNLVVFLVLGIFTYLYLDAIKPNLVKNRSNQHARIINNTSDHIQALGRISRLMVDRSFREAAYSTQDAEALFTLFHDELQASSV